MTPLTPPTLQGLRLRENQLFLALTILVGVLAGLSAVLFTLAIERLNRTAFGLEPSSVRLFLVPTGASLVAGILLATVFPDARGSGVPQTKAAFHLHGGRIPLRVPIGKFIMGALCVGSGHSMGREGPSVQIGAGVASAVGAWIGLPPHRNRELLAVGAAGALSAAFNTPVAAVIFALEELIGDLNAPLIGSTVVASVTSVIVERSILGNEPLFRVPTYHLVHPAELAAYGVLGIVGGLLSIVFCRTLLRLRAATLSASPLSKALLPAVGGAVIGLLLLVVPETMGVGYEYVDQALNGGMVLDTLLLLCAAKMVATLVSYASGNAGGIFAPSLYIGAMAGGAIGMMTRWIAPFPTADAGAYALVGMGALFAGIIRAPMTSVFMIFEITQDYQILVPLMVANMLSFALSRRYQPVPIYHALLEQDGIYLPPARPASAHDEEWTAGDAMREAVVLPSDQTVREAVRATVHRRELTYLVGAPDGVISYVTAEQLFASMATGRALDRLHAIAEPCGPPVDADDAQDVVLRRLASGPPVVPVVRGGSGHDALAGVIGHEDVVKLLAARETFGV